MITTIEQFDKLPTKSGHYRPEYYLSRYKFSLSILLDVFATDYMVYCYEDWYYNDFTPKMVAEYQPHIDISQFTKLYNELQIILRLEKHSRFVIDILEKKPNLIILSEWNYEPIEKYVKDIKELYNIEKTELEKRVITDYIQILETNDYSKLKKLYIPDEPLDTPELVISKAYQVLKSIPYPNYSSILPLASNIE